MKLCFQLPLGPVIGPLVICGYMIDEEKIALLKKLDVKDSKLLSPAQREALYDEIKKIADDFIVIKISAEDIDKLRTESNLNKIEIKRQCEIINALEPDKIVIDAIEANTQRFREYIIAGLKERLRQKLKNKQIELICENFADKKYPIVGAASIIAKVERDREIEELKKEHGEFGSGYPSDILTIKFLKDCIGKNKKFPSIVRKSWITAIEIKKNNEQKGLKEFYGVK